MRIQRLDLLAFGHFTNVTLDLSAGPDVVHVIYGSNEAGKSTALRALRALFYGIDARSADNFLHEHSRLRIGAVVKLSDGAEIDFIRRKGNKNTFLDRADNPADEAPLRAALGGVDEELFTSLFGINYERLVAGGHSLLRAEGGVGESLFSAGFGGVSLRDVLEQLESEAAQLFKPQGQNQSINQACRQHKEAREKVAELLLPSREYEEQVAKRDGLVQARDQAAAELRNLRGQNNRLERIARALPLLPGRRALTEELAAIGPVPVLPEGFTGQRLSACAALNTGQQQGRISRERIVDLDARIAVLMVPEALLTRAQVIMDLHQHLGSHLKAANDLPGLAAEMRVLEKGADRRRQELGLDAASNPQLSRGSRQAVQSLASRHRALVEKVAAAGAAVYDLTRELHARQEERQKLPDVTALSDAVQEVQRHGDLEEELASRRVAVRLAEAAIGESLKRLKLWNGTLEELAAYAVPSLETLGRYEEDWIKVENALAQTGTQRQGFQERAQQCEREMETMLRVGSVPSEAELQLARQRRTAAWTEIKRAWLETALGPGDEPSSLAIDYEAAVEQTDDLADRLRREAARVAQHAGFAAELDSLTRKLHLLGDDLAVSEKTRQNLQREWRAQWPSMEPLPPREMRDWLQKQERLIAQADQLRELRASVTGLEERVEKGRATLSTHLSGGKESSLRSLVARGARVVAQADLLERDIDKLAKEVRGAENVKLAADDAFATWQAEWREAMREIGRAETTSPEEAIGFVEGCVELQGQIDQIERMRVRIKAVRSDAERFEVKATGVFCELYPDRPAPRAEEAIGELFVDLDRAKQDATTLTELKKQRTAANGSLEKAQTDVVEAEVILNSLCQQAGCDDTSSLEAIEQKSREAAARRGRLAELDERLTTEAAGIALAMFIAETEALNADQIAGDIAENQRRLNDQDALHTELSTQIGGLDRDIQAMDGNARALEAAENAQSILAGLEEHTERFIRLKLASVILRREIEDYRVKNQSPLLAQASNFFRQLTLGSFTSVVTDFDENDNPVLEGVRSTGKRVRVSGLSDGTRDQLFLALKLATVERFVAACEPMPFIADDLLVAFDHRRERAVLETLGQLAKKTQVILFTHHQHLCGLAEDVLGRAVQVHDLDVGRISSSHNLPSTPLSPA